jgi:sugar phosphate isomerase/epimerase
MRITGAGVSAQALHEYLSGAFFRACRLGVKVVAMDCGRSRHVPDENDFPAAWRQLGNFMRLVQGHASNAGLKIAVEPIRKAECNLLNLVSEATLMAGLLQLDHVGVLPNTGSMAMASEPLSALRRAMPLIEHVHIEGALRRGFPAPGDGEDYARIFRALKQLGYAGGVSIRGRYASDFGREAKAALEYLKLFRD